MQTDPNKVRLDAFVTQLWAELYKIPSAAETARYLVGDAGVRREIVKNCKIRARPILDMIKEIKSWEI
jgi:hypothetical protein